MRLVQLWKRLGFLVMASTLTPNDAGAQAPDPGRLKQEALQNIDAQAERLGRLSDAIFSYSEVGFQEYNTVKLITTELEKNGFKVERGVAEMPTSFRATYGSGSPVIGVMADFDCVPGANQRPGVLTRDELVPGAPGHGEGHNAGLPTIIGPAIAVKNLLVKYKLPGTIVVYGGPAEELLASRVYMVNAGLFKGVDAMLDAHIGSSLGTSWGLNNLAIASIEWTFTGEQAHGASPWGGRSALDGAELMNIGMNYLREHLPLEMRFHYVTTFGGNQPNVVPPEAKVWYYFRHRSYPELVALIEKARIVAKAAAEMSFTTIEERVLSGSWPYNANKTLSEVLDKNIQAVGMPQWSAEDKAFAAAFQKAMGVKKPMGLATKPSQNRGDSQGSSSNDAGDVTWQVPMVRLSFPSQVQGGTGHHWTSAIVPATPIAYKGIVAGAKALAGTIIDLMVAPATLQGVKADFAKQMEGVTWKSLVPPGAKPPTHLNTELMAKYRPLLEKFYYNPDSPKTFLEEMGVTYPPAVSSGAGRE
ncbi:MAG: amidohydrolase [Acidobacteria bacterium]|nr:amidohydrolase [Acidobacteriota bacterium]